MGYQTYYAIEITNAELVICSHCGIESIPNYEQLLINYLEYDPFEEPSKWYDWKENLRVFSKKYPEWAWPWE